MLDSIRKNVRHPYIQALLGAVIVVFILFFGWGARNQGPKYLAKVNGDTVDYRAYQRMYDSLARMYQQVFGPEASPEKMRQLGLGKRALDQLIEEVLLAQEADRRGIKVTETDVKTAIAALPAFQNQGVFELKRYEAVLQQNRLTPAEYESMKRQELLLEKIQQAIRSEARVTDEEVKKEYEERNTKVELEYVATDPVGLRQAVTVTDKELQAAYEAQKESYRTPEKRIARYSLFAPDAHLADVKVTEEEIAREFAARGSQTDEKEAVHARHLLLTVPQGAKPDEEAKIRSKAEALLKEAKAAKDFGALAKKHSQDPGSKDKGGDLGFFSRGTMVPEFEKVAFSLKAGETSDLVKTSFGFHIIRVEERRAGGPRPLEKVRPEIEAEIRNRKALERAYGVADKTLIALEDKKETWEGLAKTLPVTSTPPVARGEMVPGVAKPQEFVNLLFSLDPAKAGNLLETDRGTYLLSVEKVVPAAIPALSEVKAQVEEKYREAEARKLAEKKASELLDAARKTGWEAAVKAAGLKPETTGPVVAKGAPAPKFGWTPELREGVFALQKAGDLAAKPYGIQGKYYVFRLASRTPADAAGLPAEKDKLMAELLPSKQNTTLQEKLKQLRAAAKIKINEEMLVQ